MLTVGITGASCSGKTTVSRALQSEIDNCTVIDMDGYYLSHEQLPRTGPWTNWDKPQNVLHEQLLEDIQALRQGVSVTIPTLNHNTKSRASKHIEPSDILIVEGLFLFHTEVLRNIFDIKTFLSISETLQVERRMRKFPSGDRKYIEQITIPAYRIFVEPTKHYTDFVFDGTQDISKTCYEIKSIIQDHRTKLQ